MTLDPNPLIAAAAEARRNAYAPYSEFPVGSAILTDDGTVYTGCNVENASFGLTNCAERTAIFRAVADGHRKITAAAIVAGGKSLPYPCGACRQVMAEFGDAELPVFIAQADDLEAVTTLTLGVLLPHAFRL